MTETDKNKTGGNQNMPDEWAKLNPEQKREQRINWWRSSAEETNFVNEDARAAYQTRMQRLIDVYNVQEPDRVPVTFHLAQLPFHVFGVDFQTGIYNHEKTAEVYHQFNAEYAMELECFATPAMMPPGRALDILGYKMYLWPGRGLAANAVEIQFVEGEYMKADEYNELIRNPSDFWMRVYLPRIFGAFECFSRLDSITDIIEFPITQLSVLTRPELLDTLQKLIDAGKELQKRASVLDAIGRRGLEMGYPVAAGSFCKAPFDVIGDTLRGTRGIMTDIYRQPDKLLEAMDVIADLLIKSAVTHINEVRGLMSFFPLHKGADGWMSQKQFDKFYWPSLRKVINALIDEGVMVSLFAEGSYNTRLESVNEFPRGTVHWTFDQTDMARAKQVLGDTCCIQGNVPSSLLFTGTPDEVKEYSRHLIEICGKGGGYILSSGAGATEAKLENIRAMVEAAKEYGTYR
jgi:uroporphyrinogen-III decarboxylase